MNKKDIAKALEMLARAVEGKVARNVVAVDLRSLAKKVLK